MSKNNSDEWYTPPQIVRALGHFDLDPCASRSQPEPLADDQFFLPEQNGLLLPWHGRVWCNPPFSQVDLWIEKMACHSEGGIFLSSNATETDWGRKLAIVSTAFLLLHHRINFLGTTSSNTRGSIFWAFGKPNVESLRHSGLHGCLCFSREIL